MTKKATTIDEQIALLRSRGMRIDDEAFARKILLDIGFYGFGFYAFPFELTYPKRHDRDHLYKDDTCFNDIVDLWEFDFKLRKAIIGSLNRIEMNVRTFISYTCSIEYKNNPTWFADCSILDQKFVATFDAKVYDTIKKNPVIIRHHSCKQYAKDKYAPAWKTLEFITLGSLCSLFENIKNESLKNKICMNYGCTIRVFVNYLHVIRNLRNECAHGGCIYDIDLPTQICKGPAGPISGDMRHNIKGILLVLKYMLGQISEDLRSEFQSEFEAVYQSVKSNKVLDVIREKF